MIHTLESLVSYLNENVTQEAEEHPIRIQVVDPLVETLEEFAKLKSMLTECIDIGKAKQNDYKINPDFSPELKEINLKQNQVKTKMERLR